MIGKIKNFSVFLILVALITFFIPKDLLAASLNTLSDKMSRQAPGIPADHEVRFTTPSGIGSNGEYVRIVFDSGFNLSALGVSDVDLLHGAITGLETNEVLAASPTATAWGVSFTASHIDLSHPTGVSGSIAPNDKVVIRIGTNAGGVHQIVNPNTIGSKIIAISGNYGDLGKLAVAIAADQIGVGGQTAGAPPNPVVLTESDVVLTRSAVLEWTQNADLDFDHYEVYFSTIPNITNLTGILVTSIYNRAQTNFTISGLTVNQDYYYVVYVFDTEGLFAPSNEVHGIITSGGGPVIPPKPAVPTIDQRLCPIFLPSTTLTGTRPLNTTIFINGSDSQTAYPADGLWSSLVNLTLGLNPFVIYAQDFQGQQSDPLLASISRNKIGDTNSDGIVDDFDLSGLAYHWETNWCYADFNNDGLVDDFDLSGLASHWDGIY